MNPEMNQEHSLEQGATPDLGPVQESARIESLDVLRGLAIMGILAMNIYNFALPIAAYSNPFAYGGTDFADMLVWRITYLFFNMKFMTIFSMLFGAGMIIMYQRSAESGADFKKIYSRRLRWLLLFGLIHAYLIWQGDILFMYAVIGFIILLFRDAKPRKLMVSGGVLLLCGLIILLGIGLFFNFASHSAEKAEAAIEKGLEPEEIDAEMKEAWEDISSSFHPTEEEIEEEIEAFRSGYPSVFEHRLGEATMVLFNGTLIFGIWRSGAVMLLGMAFMKLGVFSFQRRRRFYVLMALLGYGIGLPLVWMGNESLIAVEFDTVFKFTGGYYYNYLGSIAVALGHIGLVMLILRANLFKWLTERLSYVGRMAFSNYIMTSLVMTTIFYGYGFGLFAQYDRATLMIFVVAWWIAMLIYSPIWLKHFRFGPLEWLWRSLTYKKRQPFKRA